MQANGAAGTAPRRRQPTRQNPKKGRQKPQNDETCMHPTAAPISAGDEVSYSGERAPVKPLVPDVLEVSHERERRIRERSL